MNTNFPKSSISQSGATLVIALIILLVMSMIGISNMQSSTLQERMAGNAKQKTTARIAAESALKEAERWLTANVRSSADLFLFSGVGGLYTAVPTLYARAAAPVARSAESIADVTVAENWVGRGHGLGSYQEPNSDSNGLIDGELVAQQPQYIIEFIGRESGTGYREVAVQDYEAKQGSNASGANIKPYMFRITAIGWGKDKNIYTVLESIYKTGYGPGNFVY